MDKEIDTKFAAVVDDLMKNLTDIPAEELEDALDFNEDEQYIFDMIYNSKSLIEEALDNYDNLNLGQGFKKVYPKEHLSQIFAMLEKVLLKG